MTEYARMRDYAQSAAFESLAEQVADDPNYRALMDRVVSLTEAHLPAQGGDAQAFLDVMARLQDGELSSVLTQLGEQLSQDPKVQRMLKDNASQEEVEALRAQLRALEADPVLRQVLKEVDSDGPTAMLKYALNFEVMDKLSAAALGDSLDGMASANTGTKRPPDDAAWLAFFDEMSTPAMEQRLAEGCPVNHCVQRDGIGSGFTVLHAAALYCDLEAVRALLRHRADVNARAKVAQNIVAAGNSTPLHWAVCFGRVEQAGGVPDIVPVVEALVAAGADVSAVNSEGKTAAQLATQLADDTADDDLEAKLLKVGKILRTAAKK